MIYLEIITAESETNNMTSRHVMFGTVLVHSTQAEHYLCKADSPGVVIVAFAKAMIDRKEDGCVFPGEFVDNGTVVGKMLRISTKSGAPLQIPLKYFDSKPEEWFEDIFTIEWVSIGNGKEILRFRKDFHSLILAAHVYLAKTGAKHS